MPPGKRRPIYGRKPTEEGFADQEVTPPPSDTDEAITRLWHLRNIGDRVERAEIAIAGYTKQVEYHQATLDQWVPKLKECIGDIDAATQRQTEIGAHLDAFFEREWPRLTKALDGFAESIRDMGSRLTKLETCVKHVGEAQETQAAKIVALESKVNALELDHRDKRVAVAERKRIFSWARAGVVALAAACGFVAEHVVSLLSK